MSADPDGKQVASSSLDSHVRIWDVASGEVQKQIDCGP
eukprot:COSAG02_NODE_59633_length_273_cov_2.034483_1_plen_37_part_01